MIAIAIILALSALAVMWLLATAPWGYETDEGFFFGEPEE